MPIDMHIEGDAASCRVTAGWLGEVGQAARNAANTINVARTTSEGCWNGVAADKFRATAGRLREDGDDGAEQAEAASRALTTFAGAVDTAKQVMGRARDVAVAGGLVVVGETIQDPVAAPAPLASGPGTAPPSPELAVAHQQAVAAATSQRIAYEQARTIAEDARSNYERAQQELQDTVNPLGAVLHDIKNGLVWASRAWGFAAGLHGEAAKWAEKAQLYGDRARMWREISRIPGLNAGARAQTFSQALTEQRTAARAAGRAVENGMLLRGPLKTTVADGFLRAVTANPGFLLENRDGWASKVGTPILKNMPYAGVLVTGFGVGADITSGRGGGESVARNVIPFAAGQATTAGILAVSATGGPVTLVAVAAGIGISMGVGWVVDNYGDEIADGVGDGFSKTVDTVISAF